MAVTFDPMLNGRMLDAIRSGVIDRLDLVGEVVSRCQFVDDKRQAEFRRLLEDARNEKRKRNKIAHSLFVPSEPEAVMRRWEKKLEPQEISLVEVLEIANSIYILSEKLMDFYIRIAELVPLPNK